MHGDERDTIDERIDAAVRRYAEAPQFSDPRVALARVRARAEQEPERRWSVWAWAAPLAAALLIAVAAIVWMGTGRTKQVQRPMQVAKSFPQGLKPEVLPAPDGTTEVVPPQNTSPGRRLSRSGIASPNRCCGPWRGAVSRRLARDDRGLVMAQVRKLPKQEVFPTPQPLSPQEQALALFVSQAPPVLKEQVLAAQKQINAPIEIANIQITPLDEASEEPQTKGKDLP